MSNQATAERSSEGPGVVFYYVKVTHRGRRLAFEEEGEVYPLLEADL